MEELLKAQEELVIVLQSKLNSALGSAASPAETKDVAIALQAAIDGLVALEKLS